MKSKQASSPQSLSNETGGIPFAGKDIVKNKKPEVKTNANRFFLFTLMSKLANIIEEDIHSNFVALLKSYKVLGRILNGKLKK